MGAPIPFAMDEARTVNLTMRHICVEALTTPLQGDEHHTASAKMERDVLAEIIWQQDEVTLTPEHQVMLKERINKRWMQTRIVRFAMEQLEPKANG